MKIAGFIIIILILPIYAVVAQNIDTTKASEIESEIIESPLIALQELDKKPEFPGGEVERLKFLRENIKYAEKGKELSLQGVVLVSFIVEKDGSISNIKILRGISKNLNNETIRVMKLMPNWNPGIKNSIAVRTQIKMPIKYSSGKSGATKESK